MLKKKKNLPAVQETQIQSLGWEDPLEKEMATHSSILAWKISWTEEPGGLQSMGSQRVGHNWATNTYLLTYCCLSCLPRHRLNAVSEPNSYSHESFPSISSFSTPSPSLSYWTKNEDLEQMQLWGCLDMKQIFWKYLLKCKVTFTLKVT